MSPRTGWTLFIAIFFFVAFSSDKAFSSTVTPPFKFLTLNFNSEERPNVTGELMGELRYNALVHWIQQNDPDVIVMQEGWNYQNDPSVAISVARAVGYDVVYHVGMGFPGLFLDSNAILAKKSFGMNSERDINLPHSAPFLGDGKTWVIPFGAVSWAIGVKLTLSNGRPLYLYNAHLIAADENDRADGLRAIDSDARARVAVDGTTWTGANVIIAGDFNSEPTEPGPLFMNEAGYEDAFMSNHPGEDDCTNCGNPRLPWYDPISIGYGLVPSQTTENTSDHLDYTFTRSIEFKALASTLVFSGPYQGVWMSDHYGIFTIFGDHTTPQPANPAHDVAAPIQDSTIITITNDQFLCSDPWNNNGSEDGSNCLTHMPDLEAAGARGVTIENRSDFYFEIAFSGPGDIFTARNAALNSGEETSFSFNTSGSFTYSIRNLVQSPNPYRARIEGSVNVQADY